MDMNLDLKGLSCPGPVIETKKALEKLVSGILTVTVDNETSRDNVARYARSQGCEVVIEGDAGEYRLVVRKEISQSASKNKTLKVAAYINSEFVGIGSDELGKILMRAFLKTVPEVTPSIDTIIFVNGGVRLTTEGSPLIDTLKELECNGREIISCGTCLDFFNLLDKVKVGKVSNMYEIMNVLAGSDRVVKP
ncbi:MAG: sulfurtransferase-like selenium metabolism protein YedF [Candidatus Xenobiia bacterium LiM19]